ncbi:YkvA family protein [Rosettibacter firmus]|uniref:YkvA family protein n=1 Tax=Rosettibacter firmus TaxID=3111522 RepID=UPI00336C257F
MAYEFYDRDLKELSTVNSEKEFQEKESFIEESLWTKLEKVGNKIRFAKDVRALYRYMKDKSVPWYRKSIVIGALIYFISPIDTIPDLAPLIGYLDDLGVITAVIKFLGHELMQYYE